MLLFSFAKRCVMVVFCFNLVFQIDKLYFKKFFSYPNWFWILKCLNVRFIGGEKVMNWNSRLFKYLQRMFEWEGCWNGKILTILRYVSFSSPYRRPVSNRFQVCKTRNKARGLEREIQKKQSLIKIEIKMSKERK